MAKPSSPLLVDDVVLVKNRKKTGQQDEYDEQPSPGSSPSSSTFNTKSTAMATPVAAVDALQEVTSPPILPTSALSRLSRFLKWYTTFMSSSGNQEIGLKVLQYSLKLVAIVAGSNPVRRRLDNNSSNRSSSSSRLQQVQRLAAFCAKLSNDLSFARYMTRLFGLPAAMEAALHGSWASDSTFSKSSSLQSSSCDDKRQMDRHKRLDDLLGKILAYSMVCYYPAEHVAFVHWMAPPMPPANDDSTLSAVCHEKQPLPRTAEKWSAWSCRCWSVYILAEVVQCLLQWRKQRHEQQRLLILQQQQQQGVDDSNTTTTTTTTTIMVATKLHETNRVLRNVKLQLVRNALFILPTIHWSLPNWDTDPWLSSPVVNTLMWLETLVHLYKVTTT
jgi:hypothetical protein